MNNKPQQKDGKCAHCKKTRGKHLAGSMHCPLGSGRFPQFHRENVFTLKEKAGTP